MDSAEYARRVAELEEQLEQLQRKLEVYHCSDVNAIRRAYKSLAQHIHALDIESRHIPTLLREIETTVLSPQIVAQEIAVAAVVAGSVWATDRGLGAASNPTASIVKPSGFGSRRGLVGLAPGHKLKPASLVGFQEEQACEGAAIG
eukprot:CAMPEP_0202369838 /NCGR_PEP_ID=MMETSP1127-20130417/1587_1 /ASSEMBLY_ACC=CAM_ASM_000462 /TAXON_ID=3047 /ORGANISM="Dunaliella tertiolecta, Strain CCMP1320" /LENGTH=145 /DNA_ID=CAMNT_0048965613 /DNA_START=61 /DNA_END=497 /DNA_ORIENTATION=-